MKHLLSVEDLSIQQNLDLLDLANEMRKTNVKALIVRHNASGVAKTIADSAWSNAAVINAGDGTHEHPTQALLDALTIRNALKGSTDKSDLVGIRVLIVGDILHSRVARSNALLLRKLGATVGLCAPATLLPRTSSPLADESYLNLDEALSANPSFLG